MKKRKMSPHIRHVHNNLIAWGKWRNINLTGALDYNTKSTLHNIAKFGIKTSGHSTEKWAYHNSKAELIDELLNKLNIEKPKTASVLRRHYSDTGSFMQKVSSEGLKKSTYCYHLEHGRKALLKEILNSYRKKSLSIIV